uniref:TonB family protein n=1 Tax=Methylobacterium sp. B34 TaxID=95563 RepID=UPI0005B2A602
RSGELKAEREAKLRKIREEKLREQKREEARQERLEEIREAKAKAAREAKAREAKARAGAERSSASASRENAAGRAAAGNDPSAMRQWQGAISAAIHSRMNVNAAVGTGGGTAVVRFTVMRSGQVTGAGVARSSGVGQIDSAALAAVRGSMPAAPPGVTQSSLSVSIPLNFRVR